MNGRERENGGFAQERREISVRNGSEEVDVAVLGEALQQLRVVLLRRRLVVACRARDRERRARRERPDQPIDALVRGQAADEQHSAAPSGAGGRVALAVDAPIDDPGAGSWRGHLARRMLRYGQETVKEPR